jgi:ribonuclease P protein component
MDQRDDQADLPTEETASQAQARIPGAHEDAGRPGDTAEKACEAPEPVVRLSPPVTAPKSLKRRQDFHRVRSGGRKGRSDGIVVFAAPSEHTRLGLSVRTRQKGAVPRNRARRRIREAFRALGVRGFDVVVAAGEEATELDFRALVAHMEDALGAAGVNR